MYELPEDTEFETKQNIVVYDNRTSKFSTKGTPVLHIKNSKIFDHFLDASTLMFCLSFETLRKAFFILLTLFKCLNLSIILGF